ncbi:hypothetical protein BpHYR1_041956 [Brachionus plicatilis]|uniref:Uncharacterized protein n=1 Tax=Brachionus plicatilis TaxID=10195 RepID=A0A3M7PTA7_BRAPC|nr:hypothetical protein BpHYR1_041956 [Brachionus plicatilis]
MIRRPHVRLLTLGKNKPYKPTKSHRIRLFNAKNIFEKSIKGINDSKNIVENLTLESPVAFKSQYFI